MCCQQPLHVHAETTSKIASAAGTEKELQVEQDPRKSIRSILSVCINQHKDACRLVMEA